MKYIFFYLDNNFKGEKIWTEEFEGDFIPLFCK